MRIRGRVIRPSNLAERRLLTALGVDLIRVPRGTNPFVVARRFARAARCDTPDHRFIRAIVDGSWPPSPPEPSPEPDLAEQPRDHAVERRVA
jgi:hypothetical protein